MLNVAINNKLRTLQTKQSSVNKQNDIAFKGSASWFLGEGEEDSKGKVSLGEVLAYPFVAMAGAVIAFSIMAFATAGALNKNNQEIKNQVSAQEYDKIAENEKLLISNNPTGKRIVEILAGKEVACSYSGAVLDSLKGKPVSPNKMFGVDNLKKAAKTAIKNK